MDTDIFGPLNAQLHTIKWNDKSIKYLTIYANNLVDHALKKLEYSGNTMSDRFTSAKYIFINKYAA